MRIITKPQYKDYYDHVGFTAGHEQSGNTWLRDPQDAPLNIVEQFPIDRSVRDYLTYPANSDKLISMFALNKPPKTAYDSDMERITTGVLLIAGKLYPYVRLNSLDHNSPFGFSYGSNEFKLSYHYTNDSVLALADKHGEDWLFGDVSADRIKEYKEMLAALFQFTGSTALSSWAIDNKIVTAVGTNRHRGKNVGLNPILRDLQFQSFMDPYTLYQELSMWVDGVLTNNEKIPEPDNKTKILMHGFDLKTSFRGK